MSLCPTFSRGSRSTTPRGTAALRGEAEGAEGEIADYVLNTNTRKFHRPDCGSVEEMKAENREDFRGTREELLAKGYEPLQPVQALTAFGGRMRGCGGCPGTGRALKKARKYKGFPGKRSIE